MNEIVGLVHAFPFGSLCVIIAFLFLCDSALSSFERMSFQFFNRNRPMCNCASCTEEDDEEHEEHEEDDEE